MLFVPFVPPPMPSPREKDLGLRIAAVIEEYRGVNPGMSRLELRQALEEAAPAAPLVGVAVLIALIAVIVVLIRR